MKSNTVAYKTRDDVPEEYRWKIELVYKDIKSWEKDFEKVKKLFTELQSYKGRLAESSDNLFNYLRISEEAEQLVEKLYVYAHMKNDEDTRVAEYQELFQRAHSLYTALGETVSFFMPEFLTIPEEELYGWLEKDVRLVHYEHFFETLLRKKEHVLPEEQEKLLAMAGEVFASPGRVFSMMDNADMKYGTIVDENGKEIELTKGLYGKYQQHPDRKLRKSSYMALYKPYVDFRNTLAENYVGELKVHVFTSRARKYASTLESALFANNISVSVYENLLKAVHENLAPLHDYVSLRKKVLKLDEVHDYDLLAPLAPSIQQEYGYDEALEMVFTALKPLGSDYLNTLRQGVQKGWIDVYETPGKRSGAYSGGGYITEPYVLLNFRGTLNDVFTLAHELGHSMHSYYTRKHNPYVYGDYSIFLAEIASTLNEGLLTRYLLETVANKTEKIALLNEYLDKFARTFYRQVIFAEFELETHKMAERGEPLTADMLDELFGELYSKYHGKDFVIDRETKAMWSRIPHFYYDYYVFQYATGIAASTALLADITTKGEKAVDGYLSFLKAGSSDYPLRVLKKAGVDMESAEPVLKLTALMTELLKELKELSS